jgi:16S rRNA (cytosine967-C5)-methyltransferase
MPPPGRPPRPRFDAILLDAPCTATGTIRRHPDVPHLKRARDVAAMAEAQARLLAACRDAAEARRAAGLRDLLAAAGGRRGASRPRRRARPAHAPGWTGSTRIRAEELPGLPEALTARGTAAHAARHVGRARRHGRLLRGALRSRGSD